MANGLVEYSIEAKPEIKSIFESVGVPTPAFNQLKKNNKQSMDAFKNAISKAKQSLGNNGASVELKDDYTDINLYLSEDGESGFGIKPNGDIVSVFSSSKEKGRSSYMLEMAISQGGRQLDCFDIYLTKIYETHGFKPVAKMKWNDEYIPEGWNKENFKDYNNGEPALTAGRRHVVFMAYDPNNDIEKQHESLEDTMEEIEKKRGYRYKRKTREDKIPYIIDYDDGDKFQHQYKWRSPAEREAIYNNMLKRYKNAKTTEELKKVVFDNDKPLEVFNRQLDDLGSLSKEQAQSIRAEYSKRYLELIKDENPEEYKKNKKYFERKYNIKSDASIYIDSLIDTIEYIDKKKEFKESDVNRDADGKFAKKPSSNNKSNDKKDNDIEITDNDRILFMNNLDNMIRGFDIENDINDISENRIELIKKGIASGRFGTIEDINKEVRYNKALEKSDKDKYNKYKEYKETAEYKEKMKKVINQFEGDTKATAEKLYSENLKGGSLISEDGYEHFELDEEKLKKLNPIEKAINYFTENYKNRNKQGFKNYQREIKDLINKSMPKEISLYRYETEEEGKKRYNLKVGDTINMSVRSFCNSEKPFENCRALQLRNRQPNECVIYKVEGSVKSLEIQSLSKFINQYEHIVDGDFEITEIREATNLTPKIITIRQK